MGSDSYFAATLVGKVLRKIATGTLGRQQTGLRLYFNQAYGFVRTHYNNINGTAMHVELIEKRFKRLFFDAAKITGITKE